MTVRYVRNGIGIVGGGRRLSGRVVSISYDPAARILYVANRTVIVILVNERKIDTIRGAGIGNEKSFWTRAFVEAIDPGLRAPAGFGHRRSAADVYRAATARIVAISPISIVAGDGVEWPPKLRRSSRRAREHGGSQWARLAVHGLQAVKKRGCLLIVVSVAGLAVLATVAFLVYFAKEGESKDIPLIQAVSPNGQRVLGVHEVITPVHGGADHFDIEIGEVGGTILDVVYSHEFVCEDFKPFRVGWTDETHAYVFIGPCGTGRNEDGTLVLHPKSVAWKDVTISFRDLGTPEIP